MDGHSALNASQCKACRLVLLVLEYGDATVLQDRGRKVHWIKKQSFVHSKISYIQWHNVYREILEKTKRKYNTAAGYGVCLRRKIHLMFERRVYSAKLRGLVLQLVHYQASLRCSNHCHGVHLHITVKYSIIYSPSIRIQVILLISNLQHLHSSISLASAETSWDWESGCPRTEGKNRKAVMFLSV